MPGFFVVPRDEFSHPVFGNVNREPMCKGRAWLWLVEHAVYKPTKVMIEGQMADLDRGELSFSIRDLGGRWGWPTTKVVRFVSELSQHRFIGTRKIGRQFVIRLLNYERFSFHDPAENSSGETKLERSWNDVGTGKKEGKEGNTVSDETVRGDARATGVPDDLPVGEPTAAAEGRPSELAGETIGTKAPSPKPSGGSTTRGTRLPPDWQPSPESRRFGEDLGLDVDAVAAEYRDYWVAVPGQRGLKLNWEATFRNRCRDVAARTARANGGGNGAGKPRDLFDAKQQRAIDDRERAKAELRAAALAGGVAPSRTGAGFGGRSPPIIDVVPERIDPGNTGRDFDCAGTRH